MGPQTGLQTCIWPPASRRRSVKAAGQRVRKPFSFFLTAMLNDIRFAIRVLMRAKGWTAVVVISLALGIGANTALFSAASGLLLRKIPVKDPDSLVRLRYAGQNDMMTGSSDYGRSAPVDGSLPTAAHPRICISSAARLRQPAF